MNNKRFKYRRFVEGKSQNHKMRKRQCLTQEKAKVHAHYNRYLEREILIHVYRHRRCTYPKRPHQSEIMPANNSTNFPQSAQAQSKSTKTRVAIQLFQAKTFVYQRNFPDKSQHLTDMVIQVLFENIPKMCIQVSSNIRILMDYTRCTKKFESL